MVKYHFFGEILLNKLVSLWTVPYSTVCQLQAWGALPLLASLLSACQRESPGESEGEVPCAECCHACLRTELFVKSWTHVLLHSLTPGTQDTQTQCLHNRSPRRWWCIHKEHGFQSINVMWKAWASDLQAPKQKGPALLMKAVDFKDNLIGPYQPTFQPSNCFLLYLGILPMCKTWLDFPCCSPTLAVFSSHSQFRCCPVQQPSVPFRKFLYCLTFLSEPYLCF